MKKMILLACAAIGLAACEKDNSCAPDPGPADNLIRFSPTILSSAEDQLSRTTYTGVGGSTANWTSGDAIGIFGDHPIGSPAANVQYSYNGTAWSATSPMYWSDGSSTHKFVSYYPYAAGNSASATVKLPALAGQNGTIDPARDFLVSNNLWTAGITRPASSPYSIALVFTHALTLIEFDIAITGFAANTTLTNFTTAVATGGALITSDATTSTINLSTGAITAGTTANTIQVTPASSTVLTTTATKLYLLILPGTFTTPTLAINLSEAGTTSVSVPATAIGTTTFAAGNKYTYAVNVTRTAITISNPVITDWISNSGNPINPAL